ncbi:MAG: OmpA family protein [Deltaproteobacteria bacterium]|nr:OmpA family protein [Deltaproteobacteria bacterium]
MEEKARVIIKKVKKKSHEGAHGGSWKVAYADFVTAMMAFFLLLWLLAMAAPEQKASLSEYFTEFNVFESKSQSSGKSILEKSAGVIEVPKPKPLPPVAGRTSTEELARKMRASIDAQLQSLKNQVFVDATKEGVRIQIVDNEGSEIFRLGSDEPTDKARQIIRLVCENIRDRDNRIVIEGHTDSAPFKSGQKTNWELSTSRASAARRELENNGVDPSRIARVIGYADQEPLFKENPRDLRNRRISIILLQEGQR